MEPFLAHQTEAHTKNILNFHAIDTSPKASSLFIISHFRVPIAQRQ